MAVKIIYLRPGEKPPEGAYFVALQTVGDDRRISFERVGQAIAEATEQGHDTVYVESQLNA